MARKVLIQIRRGLEKDIGTLSVGELGYCEDTEKLYIGTAKGNVLLVAAQTVGDMLKSIYDTNNDGKVDMAEVADKVPWNGVTGKPSTFIPSSHTHTKAQITDFPTTMSPEYTAIPANADLNNYTNIGFYGTASSAIAGTILNRPNSAGFTMIVSKRGNFTTQILIDMGTVNPYMWIRSFSANWGNWYKVPFEGDIPTKVSQLQNDAGYLKSLPSHNHDALYMKKGPLTWNDLKGA